MNAVKSIVAGVLCLAAGVAVAAIDDNLVVNGDFEESKYTGNYWERCGSSGLPHWTCDNAGICTPQGTYLSTAIKTYDNTAWAFLKSVSSISQEINFPNTGAYVLEFDFCGRPGYIANAQTLVTLDGVTVTNIVGAGQSSNGAKIDHVVCMLAGVNAGTHELKFAETKSGDLSPAFDNIVVRSLTMPSDVVTVYGSPSQVVVEGMSPGYGDHDGYVAGKSYELSVPSGAHEISDGTRATCVGWNLVKIQADGTREDWRSGSGNAVPDYVHPDCSVELTWTWMFEHRVTATAGAGGSVSPTEQWVTNGCAAVVSATADRNKYLFGWSGGVSSKDNPLTIVNVTAPIAVTATFNRCISVEKGGSDGAAGTEEAPYASVGRALEAAVAGDCIRIGEGRFLQDSELIVGAGVTIVGAGRDLTILDAQSRSRVMTIKSTGACVSDLTITKGQSGNQQEGGGAIVSAGVLRRCRITDNYGGGAGGGLSLSGSGLVSQCLVCSNCSPICWGGVGVIMSGNSVIEHSIVFDNMNKNADGSGAAGGPGGGIYMKSNSPTVRNCTVYGNWGTTGGGICNNTGSRVIDTIVWGNHTTADASAGAPDWTGSGTNVKNVFSSVAWGTVDGDYNLVGNPDFKDAAQGDFRLKSTSSCCDAASGAATVDTDVYGNPRVRGERMDIGAIENDPDEKSIAFATQVSGTLGTATVTLTAKGAGFDIAAATCYWTFDGRTPTADDHDDEGLSVTNVYGAGAASAALSVIVGDETYVDVQRGFTFVYPEIVYVRETNPNAAAPYATWETATTDIQSAIDAAGKGSTVLVSNGVYSITKTITLLKQVTVTSVEGAEKTIVDGGGKCRCLSVGIAGAVVEGLTIRNANAGSNSLGGGAVVTAGTLRKCILTGNTASRGSGVDIEGSGRVSQCLICTNTVNGWGGGGVSMYTGSPVLEHSLVFDNYNKAKDGTLSGGGVGGGVYLVSGSPTVRNCTVYGNYATQGGGIYNSCGNSATVVDTIVWGNHTSNDASDGAPNWLGTGTGIKNVFSAVAWGTVVGDVVLVGNPDFKDAEHGDFRLKSTSACCDAACGEATVDTDVYGNPRVRGVRMDIGAVENDPDEKSIAFATQVSGSLDTATVSFEARGKGFDITAATCYWTFDGRTPTADDHDEVGVTVSHDYGLGTVSAALAVVIDGETLVAVQENFAFVYPKDVYVRETNPDAAAPYATWETAATNIQAAIDVAGDESTVHVSNGTYVVTKPISVEKQVTVTSVEGAEKTVISGRGKCQCVKIGIDGAVVEGFTITEGAASGNDSGGGAVVSAGTLRKCVVCNCSAICASGVYIVGSGLVSQCLICTNAVNGWGGGGVSMASSSAVIEHSLVFDNFNREKDGKLSGAGTGGGIFMQANYRPTVRSCTVYGNYATQGGGIYNASGANAKIVDTIVWGNHTSGDASVGAPNWYGDGTGVKNVFSAVAWGSVVGDFDLTGDPGFVDAPHGNFHLKGLSPCRDAASGEATVDTDVYGDDRVQGERMDIGAVENDPNVPSVSIVRVTSGGLDTCTVDFSASAKNFDIAGATCYWTFDGRTPTVENHDATGAEVRHVYGIGTHSVALLAVCGAETFEDALVDFVTVAPSKVYVVAENEHAEAPFSTWATAATNVHEALAAAAEQGTTVFVSNGTYRLSKQITIDKQLTLKSVNGPLVTTLDACGNDRVVNQTIAGSTIAGFTITGGYGPTGAGIRSSGGVVTNCIIRGNRSTNNNIGGGVAIAMYTGTLVTGCVISNNTIDAGYWGAGVDFEGGTLENTLICDNRQTNGGNLKYGAGVYSYHGGDIRNCTITGNKAGTGTGGGIYWNTADGSVINSIIWGNQGAEGLQDISGNHPSRITNVCASVSIGVNRSYVDLVQDPQFVDAANGDYRIKSTSPCRNTGWGPAPTAVDLDGNPRLRHRKLDIGCYECQIGPGMMMMVK